MPICFCWIIVFLLASNALYYPLTMAMPKKLLGSSVDSLSIEQIKEALQARRRNSATKYADIDRNGRMTAANTLEGLGKFWTPWELLLAPSSSSESYSKPCWLFGNGRRVLPLGGVMVPHRGVARKS